MGFDEMEPPSSALLLPALKSSGVAVPREMFLTYQSSTDPNKGPRDRDVPKTDLSPVNSPICTLEFIARCSKWWQTNSTGTLLWLPGSVCARTQTGMR